MDSGRRCGKKDLSTWEWLARAVRHRSHMVDLNAERGPGPWTYLLNENGVDEFVCKWPAGPEQ